jgi:predicted phosphodiesterase
MGAPRLPDEILQQAVGAVIEHGSQAAAADALGIARNTLQNRLKHAAERGMMGFDPVPPGFSIRSIATKQGQAWIRQVKEPGPEFQTPEGHRIKGVSALLDPDNRVLAQWVKTREDTGVDFIKAIKESFDGYEGRAEPIPPPAHTDADLMSVYPIADQHNGLLAWGRESGENYDLKIGADRLRSCMAKVTAQSPPSRQALILNLGDWTHQDDNRNMTPRSGNILDVDGRYFKVLTTGVQLMMDCIDLALQKHEHVLVRNIPGNHDPHASLALTVALSAFYAREPRVTIDDDPSEFFFHRFGATLIGANHGHRMKPQDMAMAMAVRCREDWGATRFHWFLFGHIHHETAKEVGDVRCESFQSLAAKDAHHSGSGYCSGQSLSSVTLHVEEGEIGRHRINIGPPAYKKEAA